MKKGFLLLCTLLISLLAFGQERTISGIVTDSADGTPLTGVNIYAEGTNIGTTSGVDGTYELQVTEDKQILVFSFVGYYRTKEKINGRSQINVSLKPKSEALDEIVVIGYGTQKKSLLSGAISKVTNDDLTQNQSRIERSLQGKTAGVNIMQESGAPGAESTIRIRGTGSNRYTEPLFIVDGMRTDGMGYLNPNDIESIEVLKDAASAAIYGAEGANGVVLITTKSGKGEKSIINYNYNYGFQEAVNYFEPMNTDEYVSYFRDGRRHEIISQFPPGTEIPEDLMKNLIDNAYPFSADTLGKGTNWMNEIFQLAPKQQHQLSIQGGTDKTNLFASASVLDQDGIVGGEKANFNRVTTRLNVNHEVKKWLDIGSKISYTHLKRRDLNENNEFGGVVSNAIAIDPITPVYVDAIEDLPNQYLDQIYANFNDIENSSLKAPGDKGYYGMSRYVQNEIVNPVAQINNDHGRWSQDKLMAGFYADIEPIENLHIKSTYDIDLSYGNYSYWIPRYYYHSVNYNYRNSTGKSTQRWFSWQFENIATYKKSIGNHSIDAMGGISAREENYSSLSGRGEVLQEESWNFAVLDAVLSDTTRAAAGGIRSKIRLFSYFGRLQYNFNEKYLVNTTLRADGSSKLAKGNKFRYFPSVSLGWVVSKEKFPLPDIINFLKLRTSWGRNGSIRSLNNFEYVSTIVSNEEASYYLSGGTKLTGSEPSQLANPELVWETSDQIDIGFDLYLLQNQITISADYFRKKTIDLITEGPVAYYLGNDKPSYNAGDVINQGLELELGLKKKTGNFSYDINATVSYLKNEVTYIGNKASVLTGANLGTLGAITRSEEGKPLWFFYGYESLGIFKSRDEVNSYTNSEGDLIQPNAIPGDIKFKDINGDGKISEDDKTMIGNPHPKWTFSLSSNLKYKNFDLNLFFNGRADVDVYFGAHRTDLNLNNKPEFFYKEAWTTENTDADFMRMTAGDGNNNFSHNSMFVFDGSFIRLQRAELGYTLPQRLTNRINIGKLRVYIAGQNIFLLTKYPGDPEIGDTGYGGRSIGVDRGLYPRARIFSVGANLTL